MSVNRRQFRRLCPRFKVNIKDFLKSIAEGRTFPEKVFTFSGNGFSWHFFSRLVPRLASCLGYSTVSKIDSGDFDSMADLERRLQVSFLGTTDFLWFGDTSILGKVAERELLAMLSHYQGSHVIAYYVDKAQKNETKDDETRVFIECAEPLIAGDCALLARVLYPEVKEAFDLSMGASGSISLETAALFLAYLAVGGSAGKDAFSKWSERLIAPDRSLFKLAQFLFSKDRVQFMSLWQAVRSDYPSEFWIAFWSEQLWQAHIFVTIALQGDLVLAKKSVNRLPFSFMQRDWKSYKVRELAAAHSILYGVDHASKNGVGGAGLDLFVLRFLTGSFARI